MPLMDALQGEDGGPNRYLAYLLGWVVVIGLFVLFVFSRIPEWVGLTIIGLLVLLYVGMTGFFHRGGHFRE